MVDSKYFGVPFGATGDRATIPEATQPGGQMSYQQGFGPAYELDPATDPAARRVPRDETNEYLYQITNSLKFLQLYGFPEWYATDDLGAAVSYPQGAVVRKVVAGKNSLWVSLTANNTTTPGVSATWSIWGVLEEQSGRFNYAVAAGSANALTASLFPPPAFLTPGLVVQIKILATNTGPASLNLNGFGVTSIIRQDGGPLQSADLAENSITSFVYDGASWRVLGLVGVSAPPRTVMSYPTAGTYSFTVPAGVFKILSTCVAAGGGAGGVGVGANSQAFPAGGGGAGGTIRGWLTVTPGQVIPIVVGAGGAAGNAAASGGASSYGTSGAAGGGSSVGSSQAATGGGGGGATTAVTSGGLGGAFSGLGIGQYGGNGTDGSGVVGSPIYGGNGGVSSQGGGGRSSLVYAAAILDGRASGSGGGSIYGSWSAAGKGGKGADGIVIFEY